jgi:hypothetical protein
MSPRRSSRLRLWLPAAALAAAAACHSTAPRVSPPAGAAAPHDAPDTRAAADPSYDWHVLLIAPFGSVLKEVPATLHEVLLFRDDAHGAAADDGECYAPDSPAPRFVGRAPEEYLLCFKQDRLARIHASVRLSDADAPEVFAAACTSWLHHAAERAGVCEGSAGDIRFSAQLGEESALSIVLESVSDP